MYHATAQGSPRRVLSGLHNYAKYPSAGHETEWITRLIIGAEVVELSSFFREAEELKQMIIEWLNVIDIKVPDGWSREIIVALVNFMFSFS